MSADNHWVVIPAAGTGTRMQSEIPKQYLQLCGKTILEHTVQCFLDHGSMRGIVVVLNPDDTYWQSTALAGDDRIRVVTGGDERCHSVLNGLHALADLAADTDWVLVHDAARPCLGRHDIDCLLREVGAHPAGGLLAAPVRDTLKRANPRGEITATVDRERLWQALTPQMFRYAKLTEALKRALDNHEIVTDEAQAIEMTGVKPLLIRGDISNIKITQMGDLELAELYLQQRGASPCV